MAVRSGGQPDPVCSAVSLSIMSEKKQNGGAGDILPAISMFFVVMVFFSAVMTPFLAATNQPDRNLRYINVLIVDLDGGIVGSSLISWAEDIKTISGKEYYYSFDIITFEQHQSLLLTPEEINEKVLYGDAWAAIYATSGATDRLDATLAQGCISATYDPKSALVLVWDQARSFTVEAGLFGSLTRYLPVVSTEFSAHLLATLPSNNLSTCIGNGGAAVLSNPVDFETDNLSPTSIAPVGLQLTTLGNILVAVFSSLFIVNAVLVISKPAYDHLENHLHQTLYRALLFVVYGSGMAGVLATIVVALAAVSVGAGDSGDGQLYSGVVWVQIFATGWLHSIIWSFGVSCSYIGWDPRAVPFTFIFFVFSSVLGGWNVDLADKGFKSFYQVFPFSCVSNILKNVLYGTLPYTVVWSASILIGYAVFFVGLFFYLSWRNPPKSAIDVNTETSCGDINTDAACEDADCDCKDIQTLTAPCEDHDADTASPVDDGNGDEDAITTGFVMV